MFHQLSPQTFPYLYKSIVRPCLEYGNIIWGPNYKGDEDEIEKVQKYATKMVPSIKHLPYEERLRYLKLPSLKYRRLCGDMIMTYNILNGHLNGNEADFFTRAWMATRGHSCRLFKQFAFRELWQNYFPHRVVKNWNSLPSSIV